jgi:HEAT repeat protein
MKSTLMSVALGLMLMESPAIAAEPPDVHWWIQTLIEDLKSPSAFTRQDAAAALAELGPGASEAVPALIPLLKDASPPVRRQAAEAINSVGPGAKGAIEAFLEFLKSPDEEIPAREAAIGALGRVGQGTPAVIAALTKTLQDKEARFRTSACSALGNLGLAAKEAVPALTEILLGGNPEMLYSVNSALWKITPPHDGKVEELIQALASPDPTERWQAAWGLKQAREVGPKAVAALVQALGDKDARVRRFAVEALYRQDADSPAGAAIQKLFHDPDPLVRRAVVGVILYRQNGHDWIDRTAVLEALKDPDLRVRRAVVSNPGSMLGYGSILSFGFTESSSDEELERRRRVAAALIPFLNDADTEMRYGAAWSLGKIHQGAEEAVPKLATMKNSDPDSGVRWAAEYALFEIDPGRWPNPVAVQPMAGKSVPELLEALKTEDYRARISVAYAIGQRGPAAKAAIPALRENLACRAAWILATTAEALRAVGDEPGPSVQALTETIWRTHEFTRVVVCMTLGRFGPAARPAEGALVEALKTAKDDEEKWALISALRDIGPTMPETLPLLLEALGSKTPKVYIAAAGAVGKFGPAAQAALPLLIPMADNSEAFGRQTVEQALKQIGPPQGKVVREVIDLLKNERPRVRAAAVAVLGGVTGDEAKTAIDAVIRTLDDPETDIRIATVAALAGVTGDQIQASIAALVRTLKDTNPDVRKAAAAALGRFGPTAKMAQIDLREAARKENITDVKAVMTEAILKIQSPAE